MRTFRATRAVSTPGNDTLPAARSRRKVVSPIVAAAHLRENHRGRFHASESHPVLAAALSSCIRLRHEIDRTSFHHSHRRRRTDFHRTNSKAKPFKYSVSGIDGMIG